MIHTKKWFLNRVNKRIFRDDSGCPCHTCKEIVKSGLIIFNKDHAEHVYDSQNEYANEDVMLNYRDKL